MQRLFENNDVFNKIEGYSLGWASLDNIICGVNGGEVTAIAGRSGSGKSTFLYNIIYNISRNFPLYIGCAENNREVVARKCVSLLLNEDVWTKSFISESEIGQSNPAFSRVFCNSRLGCTVDIKDLVEDIESVSHSSVKFVTIDNVDYISSDSATDTISSRMSLLRGTVVINNMHAIVTCSNNDIESIAQYADNVILIDRLPGDITQVQVIKNRFFGNTGTVHFSFNKKTGRYATINMESSIPK